MLACGEASFAVNSGRMEEIMPTAAAPSVWVIDEARSTLEFAVSYLTIKKVSGRFSRFGGTIHLDPADLTAGWAEVVVDPASVDAGIDGRNQALRQDGFLDVARFPSCRYRARRLTPLPGGRYRLDGDLTLHGVKRATELELEVSPAPPDGPRRRLRFVATGRIDRKRFGVDWNPLFDVVPLFIGHQVEVKAVVEAIERGAPAVAPLPLA
jgi:polyisoprenoid-binding protein YceI